MKNLLGEIAQTLQNAGNIACVIWATDNSEKVAGGNSGGNTPNEMENDIPYKFQQTVGRWAYSKESGQEMAKDSKIQRRFPAMYNKHTTSKNHDIRNNITWTSGDGERQKQLDYITISHGRNNLVANAVVKGAANSDKWHQRRIVQLDMDVKLQRQIDELGALKHIGYNIQELRNNPENSRGKLTILPATKNMYNYEMWKFNNAEIK